MEVLLARVGCALDSPLRSLARSGVVREGAVLIQGPVRNLWCHKNDVHHMYLEKYGCQMDFARGWT